MREGGILIKKIKKKTNKNKSRMAREPGSR
jgi:hypothetical protein